MTWRLVQNLLGAEILLLWCKGLLPAAAELAAAAAGPAAAGFVVRTFRL